MTNPTCILIHPDGTAEWSHNLSHAEQAMGPYGIGRTFLTGTSQALRISMSDCALILTEEFNPNPYAVNVLATLTGTDPNKAPETRGPIALFAYDPRNDWDNTRPFTNAEQAAITAALQTAGCTTTPAKDQT